MAKLIVIDLDGTLTDGGTRAHLIPEDKTDVRAWDKFNTSCEMDLPVGINMNIVYGLYQRIQDGLMPFHDIVIVTARNEVCEQETVSWLSRYGLEGIPLYMRSYEDARDNASVKSDYFDQFESDGHEIVLLIDDDQAVVEMARKRGIYTLHATEWWKYGFKVNNV